MGKSTLLASTVLLSTLIGITKSQFMGYPYDYSSMFQGYTGYNPMMSMTNSMGAMNTMGMNTGFGTFGTGMENLYGGGMGAATQQAFGAYNPYGNGMFNFAGNNNMFGQNAFGTGFNTNNMFGTGGAGALGNNNGMLTGGIQQVQQGANTFQTTGNGLNNGNTMRAYGRRSTAQNFNNNYTPTRVGQNNNNFGGGCNGFGGGCGGQQQGWNSKTKKV